MSEAETCCRRRAVSPGYARGAHPSTVGIAACCSHEQGRRRDLVAHRFEIRTSPHAAIQQTGNHDKQWMLRNEPSAIPRSRLAPELALATPVLQWSLGAVGRQYRTVVGNDYSEILQLAPLQAYKGPCRSQRASAEVGNAAGLAHVEPLSALDCELDCRTCDPPLLQPLSRVGADHKRWSSCPSRWFTRRSECDIVALFRPICFKHGLPCRDAGSPSRGSGSGVRLRADSVWPWQPRFACGLRGRRPHPSFGKRMRRAGK
jgi:hypothetical protein